MGMETDYVVQARAKAASGDLLGALEALDLDIKRRGGDANTRIFRARIYQTLGHLHEALEDVRHVDMGVATPVRLLAYRAELEEAARRLSDANETLTRAIALAPKDPRFLARRALIAQSLGDMSTARADLERAMVYDPGNGELLYHLAAITSFASDTPLLEKLISARQSAGNETAAAYHLDFALAKAWDQLGDADKSFSHLEAANAAMRAAYPFDVTQRQAIGRRYQRVFEKFDPSSFWSDDASDFAPIFITGMPRSGTTLVEQIISSHGHVDAAGETGAFFRLTKRIIGDPMVDARRKLNFSGGAFAAVGKSYAETMQKLVAPDAPHLTDKSLQTWMYLGLVVAALPNARVVILEREPEPTALSIYRHIFRPGKQLFSYNLRDISIYQSVFNDMRDFWMERCADAIVPVRYEELAQNPKTEIRSLIDRAGLAWDPACLSPEKNSRAVMTLSASEVRQPIHTNSLHAWKRYSAYLT